MLDLVLDQHKACSCNKWPIKIPNCFLSLAVNKMTENAILKRLIKVLHFQNTQFCGIMYKDHPDVYYFFIEGVQQKLLNAKVVIGYRWT